MERRLSAILAADVVGYSRLMGLDETSTLASLKAHRQELIDAKIAEYHGRIVKLMGDGILAEFPSVVNAVACAAEIQHRMLGRNEHVPPDRRIEFRIGINLGDVIVEGDDIFGDGVNVAARLEGLAGPGSIAISASVREQVGDRLDLAFADMGDQALKNIARPVRVFQIGLEARPQASLAQTQIQSLAVPRQPSIAVLPFANMSGDPEQEYFASGMVEEIITALSRFRGLFVIARNSTFTYKGRVVDVKQVGRELGVRYVLEGSVRKAGNRVRIAGQLIDASTGAHLWADRFDGGMEDVFELQDQVTASVVGAISPRLEQAEIERSRRKPTEHLDAYDYYLRGVAAFHQLTREGNTEALALFYQAIEIDPNFASAFGMAAQCYDQRKGNGWVVDRAYETAEVARLSRRAAEVGRDDAVALCTAGLALAYLTGDLGDASAFIDKALILNPNLALAWLFSGWMRIYLGEPEAAVERLERAMRLSPQDPRMFEMQTGTACAHFFAGRDAEALSWAEAAARGQPNSDAAMRCLAATCAMSGRQDQAEKAISRLLAHDPALRIAGLRDLFPIQRPEDIARWEEALRKAGLPE